MKQMIIPAVLLAVAVTAHADTYQFIISGYPAANESYPTPSATTFLETATRTAKSVATSIEARYRTWEGSAGIALRSDECRGTILVVW